jgi:FkbM family methyltransferase
MCRHGSLTYPSADTVIGTSLSKYGEWAELEIAFLSRFIGPTSVVLDIGAYIGTHTLPFARLAAQVYAFEPQPVICAFLQQNVRANGLLNVTVINAAAGNGTERPWVPHVSFGKPGNFGALSLVKGTTTDESAEGAAVETISIDSLGLSSCQLIKIDVEGMELAVLEGATQTLDRCRPIVFSECLSIESGWACLRFMSSIGYVALLRLTPAHNPRNVAREAHDIFNGAKEAALVYVPADHGTVLSEMHVGSTELFRVTSLDDLAGRLVETTRLQEMKWIVTQHKERVSDLERELAAVVSHRERLEETLGAIESTHANALRYQAAETDLQRLAWQKEAAENRERVDGLTQALANRDKLHADLASAHALTLREQAEQLERWRLALQNESSERLRLAEDLVRRHIELEQLRATVEQLNRNVEQLTEQGTSQTAALADKSVEADRWRTEAFDQTQQVELLRRQIGRRIDESMSQERAREALTTELSRLREQLASHQFEGTGSAIETPQPAVAAPQPPGPPEPPSVQIAPDGRRTPAAGRPWRGMLYQQAIPRAFRRSPWQQLDPGVRQVIIELVGNGEFYGRQVSAAFNAQDAAAHYFGSGWREGFDPHPLFDTSFYLERYPDVACSEQNPLVHYLVDGEREKRDPHPLFSSSYYLQENPDVAASGGNGLLHFVKFGGHEGRSPHPLFNSQFYLAQNTDVVASGLNPLVHYILGGAAEGRDPHPLFDTEYYLSRNPDVAASRLNPLAHYLTVGWLKGRHPCPLFDETFYLSRNEDVAASRTNPFLHYILWGEREHRDPHPLIDLTHYAARHEEPALQGVFWLANYLAAGGRERAHPLFDPSFYLDENPDVAAGGEHPLLHYLSYGASAGRDPHPLFDTSFYLEENPDVEAAGINPLIHFVVAGARERRNPHPLFDTAYYQEQYRDTADSGMNPLVHYILIGDAEGRKPNPLFDVSWYRRQLLNAATAPHGCVASPAHPLDPKRPLRRKTTPFATQTVYAFTSIALNYLPKARVLATSLKKHNPDICFCLLVSEPLPDWLSDEDLAAFDEVLEIEALDIPDKTRWIFKHSLVELSTAVKGYYIRELLARQNCRAAFYFDPDIVVCSSLQILLDELDHGSILLTPHQVEPDTTVEAIVDNEICSLKHGIYNLGFLGLKPSAQGHGFAKWWCERLARFCVADIPNGLFTDQRWVDLAPAFFSEVRIVRHVGCNVATWNLTNRRVEGDFETGFTVNSEPLVFYHFSGFDSGAQEVMLRKYGRHMPAAQILREWYICETERPEDRRFTDLAWAYGTFNDGEPITSAHRRLYRHRTDLMAAFPEPFDASGEFNYSKWYKAEFSTQHSAEPVRQATGIHEAACPLLVHYLQTWREHGFRPTRHFDPTFYAEQNPEIARTGADPLSHYIRTGAVARRDPEPSFHTDFYLQQLAGTAEPRNPLIHYLHEGRARRLRINPLFDKEHDSRVLTILQRWSTGAIPVILAVSHYGGGGTEKHLQDLAAYLRGQARMLLLAPTPRGTVRLSPLDTYLKTSLTFDPVEQRQELIDVLRSLGVSRLHIHHTLGNEHYLTEFIDAMSLPFDYTLHDYYWLSPNPQLVGSEGRFVGEDLFAHEGALLANAIGPVAPTNIIVWQIAHERFLRRASRVIAPSHDVALRVRRHLPELELVVAGHPEQSTDRQRRNRAGRAMDHLRVSVLGELSAHKGLNILCECARLNRAASGHIRFQLIGFPRSRRDDLLNGDVLVTGQYQDASLQDLIDEYVTDLIWYPAQWPETYSYTLSAGLKSGLPLVVPELGAFTERVSGRAWTWIQPWDLEPEEWLAFFERIRVEHFATGIPPDVQHTGTRPSSEFYDREYLSAAGGSPSVRGSSGDGAGYPAKHMPFLR